jgi:hypothetical protein
VHFEMIETLIRDAGTLPVRVFSGNGRRWSDSAESVPRGSTGKSVDLMSRCLRARTILATGDFTNVRF